MNLNLNLYKYFLMVIEERSVSKAACRLGVSQPTVSYSIHALQRELGQRLFTITKNGLVPLRRAWVLYQRLKPTYVLFMDILDDFIDETKLACG